MPAGSTGPGSAASCSPSPAPSSPTLAPGDGPTLRLPSREVFARGNVPIVVEGPCDELAAEAASVFEGFWPTP